jgi:Carboxypeptidase regulatory-like domain/TonB dependent receptor
MLLIAPASAQFKAGVEGTISDASGAGAPNATITLTSKETQKKEVTKSSAEGFYRFPGLAPGVYSLNVELAGFKSQTLENIDVSAEQVKGVNIALSPGDVRESITVSAESSPALQTEDAGVGGTISQIQIERLPQFNRDPYETIRLTPGVFGDGSRSGSGGSIGLPNTTGPGGSNSSIFQTENQVPISANGQRLSDNNFLIDGVSVNSLNWGGAAVVTPNQESVKAITVHSSAYSAEYGRNSGAQIEVVSKNGTDQFHGSGFFKYNDPALNAFNRYGGPFGAPPVRVDNKFRQYGASLGGPIVKDKLFFFFSYEGLTNKTDMPYQAWVETPQYRQSVIAARPGSVTAKILQDPGVAPRIIQVLNVPCPSSFASGTCAQVSGGLDIGSLTGGPNQYVDNSKNFTGGGLDGVPDIQYAQLHSPSNQRGNQYNFRGDYSRGNNSFAFSTYLTPVTGSGADSAAGSRPMADLSNSPFNSAYTLTYNRILSSTLFNEARFNVTRFAFNQITSSSATNFGLPRVEIQDIPIGDRIRFGAPQSEATPAIFAQNTYEFSDSLNKVLGRHALKFGLIVRKEQNNDSLAGGSRPLYTIQGLWNFANGTPIFEQIDANPQTGGPANSQRYLRDSYYSGFVQDDFKLRPNLTVNLGIRYEYFSPLTEKRGELSNLFFGSSGLSNSFVRHTSQLYQPDKNNFAPRLGFAWNPSALNSKLVLRGGYGWFYNRIPEALFANTARNPPEFAAFGICCGTATTSFGTPFDNGQILYAAGSSNSIYSYPANPALAIGIDPTTGAPQGPSHPNAPNVEIYMAQKNTPNPYVQIYSLDMEYQLPAKLVATAGYQGSTGRKQIRLVNQNFLYPNNPAFYAVYAPQPDVNTNFNALLLTLKRRYSNGFQVQANYRWSKSLDTLSYEGPGFVTNQTFPQNQATEKGPSDFDVAHYFTLSSVYDLPMYRKQKGLIGHLLGGFTLSGVLTAHTGFPWTPTTCQAADQTPGGPTLCPIRPILYFSGAGHDTSNDAFINGTNFAGGGKKYFLTTTPTGGPNTAPPGIGRNSWRGPGYLSTDLAVGKQTSLPGILHLGEAAKLDLRANLYNIFNKLNLQPIAFGSAGATIENQQFGLSPGGLAGRVVELQARFSF